MTPAASRLDLTEFAHTTWDAAVVGAGPAGAVAAHGLAAAGAKVVIFDRASFPRFKVCGCCLSSRALAVLDRCGMALNMGAIGARPYDRLQVAAGRSRTTLPLPPGIGVPRERLDAALIGMAVTAGARFAPGIAASLETRTGAPGLSALRIEGPGGESATVGCRVIVAAAGLAAGFAARELGGERVARGSRIGASAVLRADAAVPWREDAINMAIGSEGYVGAVRLADGRWNLAAAMDAGASRRGHGIGPVVAAILDGVGWSVPEVEDGIGWRGTPALTRRPGRAAAERLFAVGDAAGYVEPFTGEGMACAIESGHAVVSLALQAIERWEPGIGAVWTRMLADGVQRRMMLPSMLAWCVRQPRFAAGVTGLLSLWPALAAPAIMRAAAPAAEDCGGRP